MAGKCKVIRNNCIKLHVLVSVQIEIRYKLVQDCYSESKCIIYIYFEGINPKCQNYDLQGYVLICNYNNYQIGKYTDIGNYKKI